MASKPQLQPSRLTFRQIDTISKHPQVPQSEQKSREAIHASYEVLRNVDTAWLFESAPDAMVIEDRDGRIAPVNSNTEKMFGSGREELIGEPVEKLVPERFREGHAEHRTQYNAAPQARPMGEGRELFRRHGHGHEFPIQNRLAPAETENGAMAMSAIRDVTDLKRAQELQSSLEFEKLMSRLSRTFVNLPVERIDSELNSGLQDLAEVMDLDRILMDLTIPENKSRNVLHWWARAGLPAPPLRSVSELFPWMASRIANRETFCVSGPEDLPDTAATEREHMLSEGIKSWLAIPLVVGGELLGVMGTALIRRQQTWDSQSISRFQQAGDLFSNVLARRLAAEAQSESEERFRTVADTAPVLIWMSGTDTFRTFFNQGWLAFTGRTREEELGNGWASGIHPEDLNRCMETCSAEFNTRSDFTLEYRLRRHDGDYR